VDEERVEHLAVAFVRRYYELKGSRSRCFRARGEHGGMTARRQGFERITAEVKDVPDRMAYRTRIAQNSTRIRRLIADVLCVVYFRGDGGPRLAIIPRDEIPPEYS